MQIETLTLQHHQGIIPLVDLVLKRENLSEHGPHELNPKYMCHVPIHVLYQQRGYLQISCL